jgi:hypothetical protein
MKPRKIEPLPNPKRDGKTAPPPTKKLPKRPPLRSKPRKPNLKPYGQ